jgi:hypothetical protein
MAAQNEFYITIKRKSPNSGTNLSIPERKLIPAASVRRIDINTKRGGAVLKTFTPGEKYETYETPIQLATAKEPTNTNLTQDYATVAALGSVVGDAAAVTAYHTKVTGGDGTKGVKLLATASLSVQVIENASAAVLKVYPGTGDLIVNKSGVAGAINAAISIPAGQTWHFVKSPATALYVLTAKDV